MSDDLPRKRIIGYADKLSLAPGETIAFKASCEDIAQYRADIVRLVCADLHPQGRGWIEEEIATPVSGSYPGREQAIPVGSWALVEAAPTTPSAARRLGDASEVPWFCSRCFFAYYF